MKYNSRLLLSFVLAIAVGLGAGCAKKPDDAKISGDIQSKFSQDSGLSTKQLNVQSANGVVTLSGTVDNDAQRDAASRQAASVPGVKEVVNNLVVGAAPAPAATSTSSPEQSASASSTPPAERSKPSAGKKVHKSSASEAPPSEADSNADQMAANNAPPPPAPPDNPPTTPPPPPPPPAPKKYTIDQGTQLTIRLIDPIDSEKNQVGDTFHATLNAPLTSDAEEAVPAGVEVVGHVVDVKSASKFAGQSVVVLQLDSLSSGGRTYSIQTDQYRKQGSSRGKNTAEKVGGGAVIGGIIGALAGGGKGAAIGAAAGAGVGGGAQAASKSQQIKLPSETVLNFTLQAPVTVVQAPNPDANRPKLGDSQ
ncbi:putative Transport-associated protein [Candidatus Sulfotelmatobacter kueseliae]|uniref:Putative Transport-associated protein n=1 Tax=Candidatus Sulfotelmatobacter kueseliae TaxID=2042962 RepID=A0A2U3L0M8_9BACT|nr:putative Transport-associated protein [Candidatus Sulfotelmatobacter kueseliae]